jgi:hypothetical protein
MKYYKIHINSGDKVRGSWADGYYNVKVPVSGDDDKYEWHIACEAFMISSFTAQPYAVLINGVTSSDCSFSTSSGNTSPILFITNQTLYQRSLSENDIGIPISSPQILCNSLINIQMKDGTFAAYNPAGFSSANFNMILTVYGKLKKVA